MVATSIKLKRGKLLKPHGGEGGIRTHSPVKERIYSPPRLSNFAASPYSAVSRVSLLRHITAKSYSTFISQSFSLKRLGESNRKLPLVCLLLRCFASAPLRDRVWLARRDSNHTFGCTSPRPKPLDDWRIFIWWEGGLYTGCPLIRPPLHRSVYRYTANANSVLIR